jgi:hypothetical protein
MKTDAHQHTAELPQTCPSLGIRFQERLPHIRVFGIPASATFLMKMTPLVLKVNSWRD